MMNKFAYAAVAGMFLAAPVLAQDATAPAAEPVTPAPAVQPAVEPAATITAPAVDPGATNGVVVVAPEGYVPTELSSVTAEQLRGVKIFDAEDASVAEIADIEIGADNMVKGVITDVGGFLGMGQHRVLLTTDQISVYKNADNDLRAYVSLTKDQLKALPKYEAPNQ